MNELSKINVNILNQAINKFDGAVNDLIEELKLEREKQYNDYKYWNELETSNTEKFNYLDELANQTGHSINIQIREDIETAMFIKDELTALFEMKIIYAFKHLEINIKKLILHHYKELPTSKPKWYDIQRFFKKQNIPLNKIQGYTEVNELRLINNSLKHSHESVDPEILKIKEFKNGSFQNFETLESFYERVENYSAIFFTSLMEKTEKEVANFNDKKLKQIAEKATLNMNKEVAEKLIIEIEKKYN
ncbi:hypothetical protein GCM10023311_02850 [Flaviramulus aquimarinus]|uniref:Cthe-2314-like HEPN domain-containing protein n=1 Tax=Flaviramulus aquimarinus TaxID=1170456 RepID=A0ABP9EP25_9FLAO